jgi:hypothetical protein
MKIKYIVPVMLFGSCDFFSGKLARACDETFIASCDENVSVHVMQEFEVAKRVRLGS